MVAKVVELRPSGSAVKVGNVERLLEQVTITGPEDIHDAAECLAQMANERGLKVAVCDDISSKEPMVDADGTILNADVFGWLDDGERWWEDHRLALNSPLPRACRYESEPFWLNAHGFNTRWQNSYLEEINLADFEKRALCKAAIVVPTHLPFGQISASSLVSTDREKEDLSVEFANVERRADAGHSPVRRRICPGDAHQAAYPVRLRAVEAGGRMPPLGGDRKD